jgi:ssRNA-specific RNase YbeY (16S rRNA maturation enzyme)
MPQQKLESVAVFCLGREWSSPAYRECLLEHKQAASSQRYEKAKSSFMDDKQVNKLNQTYRGND